MATLSEPSKPLHLQNFYRQHPNEDHVVAAIEPKQSATEHLLGNGEPPTVWIKNGIRTQPLGVLGLLAVNNQGAKHNVGESTGDAP